jgi:hypothetical protein
MSAETAKTADRAAAPPVTATLRSATSKAAGGRASTLTPLESGDVTLALVFTLAAAAAGITTFRVWKRHLA